MMLYANINPDYVPFANLQKSFYNIHIRFLLLSFKEIRDDE